MLDRTEIDALFPDDLPEPAHWETRYPPRDLPEGAHVTRLSPSPTGSAHLGGVYVALLDKAVAHQSGGVYYIRIEDTDQAREVTGAADDFRRAFDYFGVPGDETDWSGGPYEPYTQSRRADIYLTYAREFLREGKAYLCFATKDELAALAAEQRDSKLPTGYYGKWAPWRDATDDDVKARLSVGEPYVVRFRSPGEDVGRVTFDDVIRGPLSADGNRNDLVILKTSASDLRLPTYHFAHAVDDHLMRTTLVIRGDEWLASVPMHLQLFDAAGFDRVAYAHIAPLMKQAGSTKRKLSKRSDPEASVEFYIEAGYPADAVNAYLRGLANSRLADLPVPQALSEPIRLEECGVAGPLVDLSKLEDISADYVATMDGATILAGVVEWATTYDAELAAAVEAERDVALRALDIERVGVANPRKDLRKWSDFRPVYGYFFTALFELVSDPDDPRFGGLDPEVVRRLASGVLRPTKARTTATHGSVACGRSQPSAALPEPVASTRTTRRPSSARSPRHRTSFVCF